MNFSVKMLVTIATSYVHGMAVFLLAIFNLGLNKITILLTLTTTYDFNYDLRYSSPTDVV